MTISQKIFKELKKQNKKQKDLADYLGLSTSSVSAWNKRGTDPPASLIPKIAEFLEVSVMYLLTDEEDKLKQESATVKTAKFIDDGTYNGTVNKTVGDYSHQVNYIGVNKNNSLDKKNSDDVVIELDELIRSLDDENMKNLLIMQIRTTIQTFQQLSESSKKKQN